MEHSTGTFRGAGDVDIAFQRWLPEGTPRAALMIAHGFGEHGGRFMNVVNRLVPTGYAVYANDHRGHGRSPGQRGHINAWSEYRDDLGAFVRLVSEQQAGHPLFLMGHSMGGLIVLEYVEQHPEGLRGVIASAPLLTQPGISPVKLALGSVISRVMPAFSLDSGLDVTAISRDSAVVTAYRTDPLVQSKGTARLSTELTSAIRRTQAGAASWTLPLLIVHGTADRLVPPSGSKTFFEHVPASVDKERHEIDGGFHEPHNDTSKEQALDIEQQWLERHL
jgi:alpha-beta hydrolase superfamily lysophospholipase